MDVKGAIDDAYANEEKREKVRCYIGASAVGNTCDAYLAYNLRGYPNVDADPRLKRIFRDGHRIETDVVKDLKKAGLHVMEVDPLTGKQWEWFTCGEHAVGHADGMVEMDDENWLLEIKSMNDNKAKEFNKKGVQYSHRHYYGQVQFMMGMSGIHKCLFVVYNKNTSEYFVEIIDFDEFFYYSLVARVETVIAGKAKKQSDDETDWRCRGCFKRTACWDGEVPESKEIRTCGNAYPKLEGGWGCSNGCTTDCADWKPYVPLEKE
jgi:hypothetical protein